MIDANNGMASLSIPAQELRFFGHSNLNCDKLLALSNMEPQLSPEDGHELTHLLRQWSRGDAQSESNLSLIVVEELRRIARWHLRSEAPTSTLQTTALINEVYLRLFPRGIDWENREHFFAVASQTIRHVLVDRARSRRAAKRDRGLEVAVDVATLSENGTFESLVLLDDALNRFAAVQPRPSRVVDLHVFAGFTLAEVAKILGVSVRTVKRDWDFAKAWLYKAIVGIRAAGE